MGKDGGMATGIGSELKTMRFLILFIRGMQVGVPIFGAYYGVSLICYCRINFGSCLSVSTVTTA